MQLLGKMKLLVLLFILKTWTGYDITNSKIKLLSGAILLVASNEPEAYEEHSQTSIREHFCKNS